MTNSREMKLLTMLEQEVNRLRKRTPEFQGQLTRTKWTPLQWNAERELSKHLNEIDMLEKRIYNLRKYLS